MTKCCINFGANYFHKEDALIISGNWHQLFAPATHINITFYWPTLFREDAYLSTNQYVFFPGFLQQANKSTRSVGDPDAKAVHTRPLQVTNPLCRPLKTWVTPKFIFPRFYFLHFAELCPKKWQLGLPRITITIIRITTTAPAGKTLTARRSHVWSLLIMASNNSNNNNNNWQQLTLINNNNSCWSQWLTKSFKFSVSD